MLSIYILPFHRRKSCDIPCIPCWCCCSLSTFSRAAFKWIFNEIFHTWKACKQKDERVEEAEETKGKQIWIFPLRTIEQAAAKRRVRSELYSIYFRKFNLFETFFFCFTFRGKKKSRRRKIWSMNYMKAMWKKKSSSSFRLQCFMLSSVCLRFSAPQYFLRWKVMWIDELKFLWNDIDGLIGAGYSNIQRSLLRLNARRKEGSRTSKFTHEA